MTKFEDPAVEAVFASYHDEPRQRLLKLRTLIFEVADATAGVGPLTETLRWGQPSYLTMATNSGTTVRLGPTKKAGEVAVFFTCHARLVSRFRGVFPDALRYSGNRAIVFAADESINEDALAQCLSMAFTYNRKK